MSTTYYKNGASITFANKPGWKGYEKIPTTEDIYSGVDTSLSTINISGSSVVNKARKVTTIKVVADEGKYFSVPPYLSSASRGRIELKKIKIETSGNKPISYLYDVVYKRSRKPIKNLSVQILYKTDTIPVVTLGINEITFGKTIISSSGEKRTIRITGTPGSTFGVAINENFEQEIEYTTTDRDGVTARSVKDSHIDKINDVSILDRPNSTASHNYGKEIAIVKGTINSSGVYSFSQKFPSVKSKVTKVQGTMAESGTDKIIFDDLTNVRVGDRIYSSNIPTTTTVTVLTLNPDGDKVNECTLSASVTLLDNAKVHFKRKRCYSIDIIPDLTSTLGPNISTLDPSYRLYQYMDPKLTIRNSISGTDMTITHNNDVATGLSRGDELDVSHVGRANLIGDKMKQLNVTSKFKFKMLLDIHASDNFTAVVRPKFNNIDQTKSDWTNSVTADNGGTRVNIYNIKFSATGNNTITLSYNVEVKKWGVEDVTMELDLDDITTIG